MRFMRRFPTFPALCLATLLLASCGGDDDSASCKGSSDYTEFKCIHRDDFVAADGTQTELSKRIADCTILASYDDACTLGELDFIAATSTSPTKQQILDRLIVSDPWMADNFANFLDGMPTDMYKLFSSVTAIVIHANIRPAFLWAETGAIYLDPDYLWLTQEEFDTISKKADYRSGFDDELKFMSIARYTKNGEYAFSTDGERTQTQALYALSALLFHELAHARDFFPVADILAASGSAEPADINPASGYTSVALSLAYPLEDATLRALAKVQYQGEKATDAQKAITAETVGSLFAADGANDDYSYSSIYEDTAMLFEEAMMKIHYGIDREVAFVTPLVKQPESCDDLDFGWIDVNRYADANVSHRVKSVVDALLPGHGHTVFLNNPVADGTFNWCGVTSAKAARGIGHGNERLTFDFWR